MLPPVTKTFSPSEAIYRTFSQEMQSHEQTLCFVSYRNFTRCELARLMLYVSLVTQKRVA